jgi:YfiH family protein
MFQIKRISEVTFLRAGLLGGVPGVVHAFSTRRAEHPQFTLGPAGSGNPAVEINRARFTAAAGAAGWPVLKLNQSHSSEVLDLNDTWAANEAVEADGAITGVRGALVGVQTADCVPLLIADAAGRAVAAVHAGWRGTAAGIAGRAVEKFRERFGIPAGELLAAIGPHNAACCYEVGADVVERFGDREPFTPAKQTGKWFMDLALANRRQLERAGVPGDRIAASTLCTRCRPDLFFSYRREGKRAGRLFSIIGIAP